MSVFVIDSRDEISQLEFPDTLYAVHNATLFDFLSTDHCSYLSEPNVVDTVSVSVVTLEDKLLNLIPLSSFVKISKKHSSLLTLKHIKF